mmetsp:Transcript_34633/g.98139  ORF Transcript_34633/g.98139 Transcript_34633/m.98139 type:complete len:112 (+) Transcript_34633:64-399(+)
MPWARTCSRPGHGCEHPSPVQANFPTSLLFLVPWLSSFLVNLRVAFLLFYTTSFLNLWSVLSPFLWGLLHSFSLPLGFCVHSSLFVPHHPVCCGDSPTPYPSPMHFERQVN